MRGKHSGVNISGVRLACSKGLYFSKRSIMNSIVTSMLDTLERDGFIKTEVNEDGEKTLVPVSEK